MSKFKRKMFSSKYIHVERRNSRKMLAIIFMSILVMIILRRGVIGSVVIEGDSMVPTLKNGDHFLFHRWPYWNHGPKRGEIVVVQDPNDGVLEIKRIVGLPGDIIQVRDGHVRLNKLLIEEPYLRSDVRTDSGEMGYKVVLVPEGHYFVMGDNRPVSLDSRIFGPVPRQNILGKIIHPTEKQHINSIVSSARNSK
jgi:signal peptidase I